MNILGAIYAGQRGLLKAKESMDLRAGRIARMGQDDEADNKLAEDLVGMKIDSVQAKASTRVIRASDEISQVLFKLTK